MKIIKRSGAEAQFDIKKVIAAVNKANDGVMDSEKMSQKQIGEIAEAVEKICNDMNRSLNVEEIQDLVENQIMNQKAFTVA